MAEPGRPLFLARDSYRRRRLWDAARLTPLLGFVLLLLPGLWTVTVNALIYIFVVWALLIALMLWMSHWLSLSAPLDPEDEGAPDKAER